MRKAHFDLLISNVRTGTGGDGLIHLMAMATAVVKADVAFLALVTDGRVEVLSGYQLPLSAKGEWQVPSQFTTRLDMPLFCEGSAHAGLETAYPHDWGFLLSAPLQLHENGSRLVLGCVGYSPPETVPPNALDRLQAIAASCGFQLRLLAEILVSERRQAQIVSQPVSHVAEQSACYHGEGEETAASTEVTADFILTTLVQARRINTRNGVSYTTTARWRTGIKNWQILALKALKKQPPPILLDAAADNIMRAMHDLVGKGGFTAVVPVPCGHSGPGCLSSLLAKTIAAKADVRCIPLFEDMCLTGSSHPKANARRPKMRIVDTVDKSERVLLIDDVATSGSHIAEATSLIRQVGCTVMPICWIGA